MFRIAAILLVVPLVANAAPQAAEAAASAASVPEANKPNPDEIFQYPGSKTTNPRYPKCQVKAGSGNSVLDCSVSFSSIRLEVDRNLEKVLEEVTSVEGLFASLDLNIPQSKGSETVTVGNLDGLANSYTVGLSLGKTIGWKDRTALFGMSVKGGPQAYTWYDGTTLKKNSETKGTYGFDAFAGRTFGDHGASALYLRYSAAKGYKDGKAKILCPPASGSDPVECVNGPIGEPQRNRPRVVTLQWAQAFKQVGTGMSLSVSHDSANHIKGIDLPVYVYTWMSEKEKPALSVGFNASWTDDPNSARKGSIAIIFSTSVFDVLSTGK